MKRILVILAVLGLGTAAACASGVGVFGSYWDTDDLGPGFGGGVKFKADLAEYFAARTVKRAGAELRGAHA